MSKQVLGSGFRLRARPSWASSDQACIKRLRPFGFSVWSLRFQGFCALQPPATGISYLKKDAAIEAGTGVLAFEFLSWRLLDCHPRGLQGSWVSLRDG